MAEKRLYPWQTPEGKAEYNNTDGLDVYADDYSKAEPVKSTSYPYNKKSTTQDTTPSTNIKTNADPNASGKTESKATDAVETKAEDFFKDALKNILYTKDGRTLSLPLPNSLMGFASFNYRLGLYALSDSELNDPDNTYRIKDPEVAVLRSGGGLGSNKVTTAYEVNGKKVEFFINNLEVETVIAPTSNKGATNAVGFRFEVMEPYSMGLFLQALQLAALQAGHKNYTESPFLLKIDFIGWSQDGEPYVVPDSKKLLPFKLVGSTLEVTGGGSAYAVEGVAYNEVVLTDQVQRIPVDVEIRGRTLEKMLQSSAGSLTTALNKHLSKKAIDGKVKTADQYFILFPKKRATAGSGPSLSEILTKGANTKSEVGTDTNVTTGERTKEEYEKLWKAISTKEESELTQEQYEYLDKQLKLVSQTALGEEIKQTQTGEEKCNVVGNSIVFDPSTYGETQQPYGLADFTWDKEKGVWNRNSGQLQIDPSLGVIKFTKGTRIQDIITEMVLISDYGKALVDSPADDLGFKNWFRIDTQVLQISDNDVEDQIGRKPRIYVYRVLPFKVHESRFIAPTKSSAGVERLKQQVCKRYDYIYSGRNDDILDLSLNMDNTFFKSISPGNFNKTSGADSAKSSQEKGETVKVEPGDKQVLGGNSGSISDSDMQNTTPISAGAVSADDARIDVARRFNEAIVSSDVDMITVDMTIMGDPYYIADSGVGNYNSENSQFINVSADGTVDYQNGEVDVELNFKTPIDYRDDGIMGFPSDQISVNQFSGLYQVITVMNQFQDGQFKQVLELVRRSNQKPNAVTDQSDKSPTKVVNEKKKLDTKSTSTPTPSTTNNTVETETSNSSSRSVRTTKTIDSGVTTTTTVISEGGTVVEKKTVKQVDGRIVGGL